MKTSHRPLPDLEAGLAAMIAAALTIAVMMVLSTAVAFAQTPSTPPPAAPAAKPPPVATDAALTVVREGGLVGEFYLPPTAGRHAAILVLGGSEGGLQSSVPLARRLANQGYATFALAYFGMEGVPGQLDRIPVEYFRAALDWLKAQPGVDPDRVGVLGASKGGEAALLVGALNPDVKVVVAGMPSSVVWQGLNFITPNASWSQGGKPMVYVPYDQSKPFAGVYDLYVRSLATLPDHPDAVIPVERINGPVLLVAGKADSLWPSEAMTWQVVERLKAKGFSHPVEALVYPDAGHAVFGAPLPADSPRMPMLAQLGGTPEGNQAARTDGWPKVLAFLAKALKPEIH